MSPSQAEGFSARLVTFFTSAWNRKSSENEPNFDSQLEFYFWLISILNLYWKLLNYAAKTYYSILRSGVVG